MSINRERGSDGRFKPIKDVSEVGIDSNNQVPNKIVDSPKIKGDIDNNLPHTREEFIRSEYSKLVQKNLSQEKILANMENVQSLSYILYADKIGKGNKNIEAKVVSNHSLNLHQVDNAVIPKMWTLSTLNPSVMMNFMEAYEKFVSRRENYNSQNTVKLPKVCLKMFVKEDIWLQISQEWLLDNHQTKYNESPNDEQVENYIRRVESYCDAKYNKNKNIIKIKIKI